MAKRNHHGKSAASKAREKAYQARPEQKKARARRNAARADAMKAGKVKKGDGKEVDHERSMARGKTRVVSRRTNRVRANKGRSKK